MKITIQQIRQIIKEELEEVYKGPNRTIYAPDTTTIRDTYSPEVGSYILPSKNPYDDLHPDVKDKIPATSDDEMLKMAYELSASLGKEIDMPVEDFIEAIKLSQDPDAVVREPDEDLKAAIRNKIAQRKSIPREIPDPENPERVIPNPEYEKERREINKMKIRKSRLGRSKLDNVYGHNTYYDTPKQK